MEETNWLKPSVSVSRIGDSACAGRDESERRASLEKDNAQADPTTLSNVHQRGCGGMNIFNGVDNPPLPQSPREIADQRYRRR
jgi:hypothetical protein